MTLHCSDFIASSLVVHFLVTFGQAQQIPPHAATVFTLESVSVSLKKHAWQSSTYSGEYNPSADKAVDGNFDANYFHGSCACTKQKYQAWWAVDLGAEYLVSDVVITNRGDCCSNRLSDFTISVGDSVNAKQCIQRFEQLPTGNTQLWCHRPLRGRIVTIRLSKTNFLTLCEVQVHGTLITVDNTGLIIGAAVGSLVFLASCAICVTCVYKRQRSRNGNSPREMPPAYDMDRRTNGDSPREMPPAYEMDMLTTELQNKKNLRALK